MSDTLLDELFPGIPPDKRPAEAMEPRYTTTNMNDRIVVYEGPMTFREEGDARLCPRIGF